MPGHGAGRYQWRWFVIWYMIPAGSVLRAQGKGGGGRGQGEEPCPWMVNFSFTSTSWPSTGLAALGSTSELRALQLQWIDRKPGFQVRDGGAEAHS